MTWQRKLCLLDNLSLVDGEASLLGGRDGLDQAGRSCFQGIWAQILTWATESPLPHCEPILWKGSENLGTLFRSLVTSLACCLLLAVGSIWFPFPFLIQEIRSQCYFRFSCGPEGLVLLFFGDVSLSQ